MNRTKTSALLVCIALAGAGCQKKDAAPAGPASTAASPAASPSVSDDEKAVSALGGAMGKQAAQQLKQLNLTPAELEVFRKAFLASLGGQEPAYAIEQYGAQLQARAEKSATAAAAGEKAKAVEFLAKAAQEPGCVKTPSGLLYTTVKPGTGRTPKPTDVVQVNYRGTLVDGTEFDASVKHGGPATFPLNRVIPCWTEGVGRMKVGEKAKLVCPSDIAYGDRGQPPVIPPGATLVFEVELLNIQAASAAQAPQGR